MSLACFECGKGGAFDTLILFAPNGQFDPARPLSSYSNLYTDCARMDDFEEVAASRFAIVQRPMAVSNFMTGNEGPLLSECKYRLVGAGAMLTRLPKIFQALAARPSKT